MDFIISKVAMAICALLVVSVLGGAIENNSPFKAIDELELVLDDLASTIERLVWSGSETDAFWRVPFLSDGGEIDISVCNSLLSAWTGQMKAVLWPECGAHTWTWDGLALNQSSLKILQAKAPQVLVRSGLTLEIRTRMIVFEDQDSMFAFVQTSA